MHKPNFHMHKPNFCIHKPSFSMHKLSISLSNHEEEDVVPPLSRA